GAAGPRQMDAFMYERGCSGMTRAVRGLLGGVLLALVAASAGTRADDAAVSEILRDAPVVDMAVTTRFYRFPGEPARPFAPDALRRDGIGAAVLGAGALTEEIDVRDPVP